MRAPHPLGRIELGALEGLATGGVGQNSLHLARRHAGELGEGFLATAMDGIGIRRLRVGEVQKRARRGELLSLEQHRRARPEQLQGGRSGRRPGVVNSCSRRPRPEFAI